MPVDMRSIVKELDESARPEPDFAEYWVIARPVVEDLRRLLPGLAWLLSLLIAYGDTVRRD